MLLYIIFILLYWYVLYIYLLSINKYMYYLCIDNKLIDIYINSNVKYK